MAEADEIGERRFLDKYGFGESRRYRIVHEGKNYPSKAILAAAHGYQFPDWGPLTHAEFSGGTQTTAKAKELGFEISVITDDLGVALARFMELFKETPGQQFSGEHPAYLALRNAAQRIESLLPRRLAGASVKPSVGQGNWASVPWIAVLHPAVTSSTQEGVYPVLLFHPDMESVEVTIAQGVTKLKQTLGRPHAYERLEGSGDHTPSGTGDAALAKNFMPTANTILAHPHSDAITSFRQWCIVASAVNHYPRRMCQAR